VQSGIVQIAYRNIAIDPTPFASRSARRSSGQLRLNAGERDERRCGANNIASKSFGEGKSFEVKSKSPRHPLRVHAVPHHHERHDRSRQLTRAALSPKSGRPSSGVDGVA